MLKFYGGLLTVLSFLSVRAGDGTLYQNDYTNNESGVVVFCGSSAVSETFLEQARDLGNKLVSDGQEVVYGGASVGTMGTLAAGVLENQGRLIGVVSRAFYENPLYRKAIKDDLSLPPIIADTYCDRKLKFFVLGKSFIALPGGFGTLDEILDVLCVANYGFHDKQIILQNRDFWQPLMDVFHYLVNVRVEHPSLLSKIILLNDASWVFQTQVSKSDIGKVEKYYRLKDQYLQEERDFYFFEPGGIDMIDMLMDVLVTKQLGIHNKPIFLLNESFWAPLITLFKKMSDHNFIKPEHLSLFHVINAADEINDLIPHSSVINPSDAWWLRKE